VRPIEFDEARPPLVLLELRRGRRFLGYFFLACLLSKTKSGSLLSLMNSVFGRLNSSSPVCSAADSVPFVVKEALFEYEVPVSNLVAEPCDDKPPVFILP